MPIQKLNPYLNYAGNAAEAIALYERALAAKTESLMRWGEMPGADCPAAQRDKIMHAELQVGGGQLMICDEPLDHPRAVGTNVHVCLHFDDVADMTSKFDALSRGGEVTMPLQETFWGATFGMLTDAFGVRWMFDCEKQR